MAVFHRYAGPCRNPKCNRTVRSNGFTVYCWSCTALDIRYGDPRQRRITQKALTKPLAAVARIRKRNPNADWHLMAENWNILVRRCQEISASKDADSLYRRKAASHRTPWLPRGEGRDRRRCGRSSELHWPRSAAARAARAACGTRRPSETCAAPSPT